MSSWPDFWRAPVVAVAVVATLTGSFGPAAEAQGRLDARYRASLSGILIGKGAWVIEIDGDKYLAAASGKTSGLLRLFSSGEGTGAARGTVVHGRLVPATYAATIKAGHKASEVRMALSSGTVKTLSVLPETKPDPTWVPLTQAHRRGVTDPMTATLVMASGRDPLVPASCQRDVSIFDGRMRYDLHLAFKRMDRVKAEKGYAGPVLVCAVYFSPIAGYVPQRLAIRYLARLRDMEVWLAPIAGTSVLAPFRFVLPTPFGLGVLEATQFVAVAQSPRPTSTGAKSP